MVRRATFALVGLAAMAFAACATSSSSVGPTSTSVSGTLGGRTLTSASAGAAKGIDDPAYPNQVTVMIANQGDACALLQSLVSNPNEAKANLLTISLVLGATNATAVVAPGTYTASGNPDELTADYSSNDAKCAMTGSESTAGSVTLSSAGPGYAGTFDLTFGPDHVTGSFDAPLCDVTVPDFDSGDDAADGGDVGDAGDSGVVCEP